MLDQPVIATMLILGVIVIGEVISILTRARIPMLLVFLVLYLGLLWTGIFPKDLAEKSNFATVGVILTAPLVVHMGTLIPLKVMKKQFKAVIIALSGVIVSGGLILLVVSIVFNYKTAVAGVGPLTGGLVAFILTSTKLKELGLVSLITIPVLVMAFQGLIGMPLASNFLRKYALKLRDAIDNSQYVAATVEASAVEEPIVEVTKKESRFNSPVILLFKLFIGGALAIVLEHFTTISYSLWCLIIGIIGTRFHFYEESMMEKANAFSVGMLGMVFSVVLTMGSITPQMLVEYFPQILLILLIGAFGIIAGGWISSKLLGWHPYKGIPVALTAMFGFPGDYILCDEVSRSVGRNKKEQKLIFDELLSSMLVGGFTTVTIASVILASILMRTI
ncbi:hypothetical protein [Priestia koreensis]|uniref:hypothetical protein n=1 Tax=Priestia koreensis TaxID=284581 RepID=UPI001F5677EB|nr:hypothetical protein [Priestia koreensis]UNL86471.1 hypothetical protein IE339_08290 [Priestia koreensis]